MVDIILTEAAPISSYGFGGGPQSATLNEDNGTFFASGGGGLQTAVVDESSPDYSASGGGGLAEIGLTELPPAYPVPQVKTGPATEIGLAEATINGLLEDDGGFLCDCAFEWGLTGAYGNVTPIQSKTAGQDFSQALSDLEPDTVYHFRAFASNVFGLNRGLDRTFRTSSGKLPSYFQNPLMSLLEEDLP